jgi:hypothetical protein
MRIFPVGLFEVEGLWSPTSRYTATEGLQPRGNSKDFNKNAEESHGQCQAT